MQNVSSNAFPHNYTDYSVTVPGVESISEGYVYSGVDDYGSTYASPDKYNLSNLKNFSTNLYDPALPTRDAETIRFLNDERNSTLNAVGITSDPSKGANFSTIGMESSGQQMFSTRNMLTSPDYQLGNKMIRSSVQVFGGFNKALNEQVITDDEVSRLESIASASQDPNNISALDSAKSSGNSEGFIDQFFDFIGGSKPRVTKSSQSGEGGFLGLDNMSSVIDSLSTAYQAYSMYEMWDYMSPAQKAAGIATVGLKGFELATGEKFGDKVLVEGSLRADGSVLTPKLTVGSAVDLFSLGVNVYGLAKNWDQLSDISKIVSGVRTVNSIYQTAKGLNLIGVGTQAAATSVNAGALSAAGFKSIPHLGVGAITGPAGSSIPAGYTAVTYTDGATMANIGGGKSVVAVPTANAATSQGALSSAGSVLNTAAGVAGIAYGAYSLYENWGTGGTEGAINGALGGASISAGLMVLGATNPFLLGGIIAIGALSGGIKGRKPGAGEIAGMVTLGVFTSLFGGGKNEAQIERDSVRTNLHQVGLAEHDKNTGHSITLADGTTADIGADGDTGVREWLNPKLAEKYGADTSRPLSAYDVDYTNDLAYAASLPGISLSRIINGNTSMAVEQLGGQLANASISNINAPDGKMTEANYNKMIANQRTMYAKVGLKTKADAYALANQMYAEGRINDIQLTQMHQSFNMIYSKNSYAYAQLLFEGRWSGIEVANENADATKEDKKKQQTAKKEDKEQQTVEKEDKDQQVERHPLAPSGRTPKQEVGEEEIEDK